MDTTRTKRTLLALAAALALPAAAQHKTPTEAQCRTMVDTMVRTMKATPAEARDAARQRELVARVDRLVADNRARGASECDSWSAIGKIVATQ